MFRVAVVGLYAEQQRRVRCAVPYVKLIFVDKDRTTLSRGFPHCDLCVLMARFIGHMEQRAVEKSLTRDRVAVCHGSVSALNRLLAGLTPAAV